jgi:hypothetical protein
MQHPMTVGTGLCQVFDLGCLLFVVLCDGRCVVTLNMSDILSCRADICSCHLQWRCPAPIQARRIWPIGHEHAHGRDTGETVATWARPPVKLAASPEASLPHHAFLDVGAGNGYGMAVWPRRDALATRP